MKVIFVAGIHAVGKSTACKAVSNEFGIPHFTASQIIRDEKYSAVSANSKLVADVADNQRLLIQGVSRLLNNGYFLLDGHFTMRRKSDGEIEAIQVDVFRELHVGRIVLFTDHPEEISKRMHARDGVLHSVEMFQSHQDAEIAHAEHVASVLGVPIIRLHAVCAEGVTKAFNELMNG
jgi:adenylate kinase